MMFTLMLILATISLPGSPAQPTYSEPGQIPRAEHTQGQSRPVQKVPHVTTVLLPELADPDAHAVVVRRAGTPGNLILVTVSTTPEEFLRAVRVLNGSRAAAGETIEGEGEIRASVRDADAGSRPVSDRQAVARAAQHLARLRRAATQEITGIGRYPAVTTQLREIQR